MKSFGKGFFTGIVTTVGVVAGAVYAFKKTIPQCVQPPEQCGHQQPHCLL